MSAEIGILFVHGIGSQVRGDTLVAFGEPIYEALKDQLKLVRESKQKKTGPVVTDPDQEVQLHGAFLSPLPTEPSQQAEPAHVRLSIPTGRAEDPTVEWIMAECHWANSFPPPLSRTVTLWIMQLLPWLCFSFFTRRLKMAAIFVRALLKERYHFRWFYLPWYSAKALLNLTALMFISPIALVLEFALILLLIVDLLPIKAVQDAVTRINLAISAVLGDCFIFSSSTFRQEAIISKLSRDLDWLEKNSERVVVIAHSQGAAITYLALKKFGRRKISLFVSFGAGILKLFQIGNSKQRITIYLLVVVTFLSAITEIFIVGGLTNLTRTSPDFPLWEAIPMAISYLIAGMWCASHEGSEEIETFAIELKRQGVDWVDFYASLDPVPNGPILLPIPEDLSSSRGPESTEVCNQFSVVADHTSYMTNRDEFLPLVIEAIGRYSGTSLKLLGFLNIPWASAFRRLRITLEKTDQTILLAALLGFLFERKTFEAFGAKLISLVQDVCDHTDGMTSCWKYSPTVTGLVGLLTIYLVLRMCIQALYHLGFVIGRWSDGSLIMGFSVLFSRCISCVALSFAILLYLPPFAWIVWLYRFTGDREYSVTHFQGVYLGLAVAILLTILEGVRAYLVRVNS